MKHNFTRWIQQSWFLASCRQHLTNLIRDQERGKRDLILLLFQPSTCLLNDAQNWTSYLHTGRRYLVAKPNGNWSTIVRFIAKQHVMYFLNINELQGFSCLNIYIAFQVATAWNLYTRILSLDMREYIILFFAQAKDTNMLRQAVLKNRKDYAYYVLIPLALVWPSPIQFLNSVPFPN